MRFNEEKFYLQIAQLVCEIRMKQGMSQTDLAKRAKVSQPMIARLEKGVSNRIPTFNTIFKVFKALGYEMSIELKNGRG